VPVVNAERLRRLLDQGQEAGGVTPA
jgi:hypothetical protein